jgi:hypothetical protein
MTRNEEILGIPFYPHECGSMIECVTKQDALKAMDEYTKEVAIGFKDWGDKYFLFNRGKYYQKITVGNDPPISYSTEQLFNIYLNHLNTIQK